jgi:hypothetical protein
MSWVFEGADRSFFRQPDGKSSVTSDGGGVVSTRIRCFATEVSIASSVRTRRGGERMTGLRRTVFRGCTLCEASCGLALEPMALSTDEVKGGLVVFLSANAASRSVH